MTYSSLPPVGDLTRSLLYAELQRLMDRAARPPLFGDEVRFESVTRREARRDARERVAV